MFVKVGSSQKDLQDAQLVRHQVFVKEQHVPIERELDAYDSTATHFILYDQNKPIGAGRARMIEDYLKIERVCVLSSYRGKGCGKIIMNKIEEFARENNIKKLKLHSQTHAEKFYTQLGYKKASDVFIDAGIPHITMVKLLSVNQSI